MRFSAFLALATMLLCQVGCKDNPRGRLPVTGTISFNGQPLNYGTIEFRPVEVNGRVATGAMIKEGKYSIPENKGLPPGSYEVRINSTEAGSALPDPTASGGARNAVERIPPDYNIRTKQVVEVKTDADPVFDFDIK